MGIGALAIPGVGPLVAAGSMAAVLAGVGVGGVVGGIAEALIGMGIPEYEAKRYEGRVKRWWDSALRPLRWSELDGESQTNPRTHGRAGRGFHR